MGVARSYHLVSWMPMLTCARTGRLGVSTVKRASSLAILTNTTGPANDTHWSAKDAMKQLNGAR